MCTVLLVVPMLNNAGAQRLVTDLALNVDKQRFKVAVATTTKALPDAAFHKQIQQNNIEIFDVSAASYLEEMKKIRRLLKNLKPDIVHTHIGSGLHMLIPCLCEGNRLTHLFTVHSMGYRIFDGIKKKIMQFAFKWRIVIPIAICDTVKKSMIDAYGLKEDQTPCVYNGVDTQKFPAKDNYCEKNAVHFVSVGTLYDLKNHAMLIEAFALVKKQCSNVKLTIVGGGELFDSLEEKIVSYGLENDVVLAGDRPNISDYLLAADVYCCSSKVEGLPITVLEAMSTGLPIITTPAGGVVDIVKENLNGYIVPHGDVEAMADKMIALAQNKNRLVQMGKASRIEALRYDVAICTKGYEALYTAYQKK